MLYTELNIILSCLTPKGQEVLGWCQDDVLSPLPLTRTKSLNRPSLMAVCSQCSHHRQKWTANKNKW